MRVPCLARVVLRPHLCFVLALFVLAAPAEADTASSCQRAKLRAMARGAKGAFACAPKELSGVTLSGFDAACLDGLAPQFLFAWSTAIAKALAQGVSCLNAPGASGVEAALVEVAVDVSALFRAGFQPSDDALPAAVGLHAAFMQSAERYLRATLAAEARHAAKPDEGKLAQARAAALVSLGKNVAGKASKAAGKGVEWTGAPRTVPDVAAALDDAVRSLATDLVSNPPFAVGILLDSGVEGVRFSPALAAGDDLTLPGGIFPITAGVMSFSVGDVLLGSSAISATGYVTPVSLVPGAADETHAVVTNMARFLQTLDDDGQAANGLTIPAAVRQATQGASLDFADEQAVVALAESLTAFTAKGARPAVSAAAAQAHLQQSLLQVFAADYSGTFDGDDSGTWEVTIAANGSLHGTGLSNDVGKFTVKGSITSSGGLNAVAGSVSTGALFQGTVDVQGGLSGLWVNNKFGESGTFEGALVR